MHDESWDGATVQPVPESARLVRQLRTMGSDVAGLTELVREIQRLVPDLVGVSLTLPEENLTVTFVENGSAAARMDALQLLREEPGTGVGSSLSLAVLDGPGAALDLYADSRGAFDGRVAALTALCGASTATVADSDLEFGTRLRAALAPIQVADSDDIDLAVGLLGDELGLAGRDAEAVLHDTARRSGVSVVHLARYIIERVLP